MRLFWRIMVISGDYLCLKCENMKYVCTVVKMTILNSLFGNYPRKLKVYIGVKAFDL